MSRRVKKPYKVYERRKRPGQWEIWERKDGKNVVVPRELYSHLDGQPRHNVEFWVSQHLEKPQAAPLSDDDLTRLVQKFELYEREIQEKAEGTREEHQRHLLDHVIPYFLSQNPPLHDPNKWPSKAPQMYYWLQEREMTKGQIFRCNVALRLFFKWLQEIEQKAAKGNNITTINPAMPRRDENTPLKMFMSPDQAMDLIRMQTSPDKQRILLLGYFFSLRPQEIFGARVGDLRGGSEVLSLEAGKTMKALGLFGGMAINVSRQLTKKKSLEKPKKNSKGWVASFGKNKEPAKLLVSLCAGKNPEDFILDCTPNQAYMLWDFDFEIKDTRRASLYWLGHNTEMTLVQMMKHARQKNLKSLELYLRRPEEKLDQWKPINLEDLEGA